MSQQLQTQHESVDGLTDIDSEFPIGDNEAVLSPTGDTTIAIPVAIGPATADDYTVITKMFDATVYPDGHIEISSSKTGVEFHALSEFKTILAGRDTKIINKSEYTTATSRTIEATLHFDGASRGNPGEAATGYELAGDIADNAITGGSHIGKATNNQAEYDALIEGIERAVEHGVTDLTIHGDSQLIVKQVTGEYNCNDGVLQRKLHKVMDLLKRFDTWTIEHVQRDDNSTADELANEVLDAYTDY